MCNGHTANRVVFNRCYKTPKKRRKKAKHIQRDQTLSARQAMRYHKILYLDITVKYSVCLLARSLLLFGCVKIVCIHLWLGQTSHGFVVRPSAQWIFFEANCFLRYRNGAGHRFFYLFFFFFFFRFLPFINMSTLCKIHLEVLSRSEVDFLADLIFLRFRKLILKYMRFIREYSMKILYAKCTG